MGLALYRRYPIVKETIDRSAGIRAFASSRPPKNPLRRAARTGPSLQATALAQPAIFCVSYSVASLLKSLGLNPSAMLGHSIGEFVAAALAGVMRLEDALAVVAARGKMMQDL